MGVKAKLQKNGAVNVGGAGFRAGAGRAEVGVIGVSIQSLWRVLAKRGLMVFALDLTKSCHSTRFPGRVRLPQYC